MFGFIIILFTIIFPLPVLAEDNLVIICDESSCQQSFTTPLFNESNIYPGFSLTKTLKIINQRPDTCRLKLALSNVSDSPLLSVENFSITTRGIIWYAGSLNNLNDKKYHEIGNIDKNQYKDYQITFGLNQSAGNEYQLLNNTFDINLNFECANDNNADTDDLCHDSLPSQIPKNLKAVSAVDNVTLFWDEPTDYFTYYLIAYGDNNSGNPFTNAIIGTRGIGSYTIKNLSPATAYYFKIKIGNGCASGNFSDVISSTTKENLSINISKTNNSKTQILGVQNSSTNSDDMAYPCIKIFPYAYILALLVNFILFRYPLITFIISLVLFLFDFYLVNFTCQKHPYFYIGNILSFLLPLTLFIIKKIQK